MRPSRETIGERSLKHGHIVGRKKSRTYAAWRNAKTRCFNTRNEKFRTYGARGVTMCWQWASDFAVFLRDMGECPEGLTLDRIDVNRGYEPGNCRWATKQEQARNRRNSIVISVNGEQIHAMEYAEGLGISYKSLWWHIRQGRSVADAASYLSRKRERRAA